LSLDSHLDCRAAPDALLHHSDRGSQYTSDQFQRLMADNGVLCSMSRSGKVWDNAAKVDITCVPIQYPRHCCP
jgi:hypothetical protein